MTGRPPDGDSAAAPHDELLAAEGDRPGHFTLKPLGEAGKDFLRLLVRDLADYEELIAA